jgi:hypothetical protein
MGEQPAGPRPDARAVLLRLWMGYTGAVVLVVGVGVVVHAVAPPAGTEVDAGPGALAVLLAPAAAYLVLMRRPLGAETPVALAAEHRQRFFLGIALAESPALFGLVGLFLTGARWVLLAGGAVSLALLAVHAPTRRSVAREDERLRAAGKPVTLSEALTGPGGR